jgi:hypothetical protein
LFSSDMGRSPSYDWGAILDKSHRWLLKPSD